MNAINVIAPYEYYGSWVFDDARMGLVQEPFVGGADTIIDRMVDRLPRAENGFTSIFPGRTFRGRSIGWNGCGRIDQKMYMRPRSWDLERVALPRAFALGYKASEGVFCAGESQRAVLWMVGEISAGKR